MCPWTSNYVQSLLSYSCCLICLLYASVGGTCSPWRPIWVVLPTSLCNQLMFSLSIKLPHKEVGFPLSMHIFCPCCLLFFIWDCWSSYGMCPLLCELLWAYAEPSPPCFDLSAHIWLLWLLKQLAVCSFVCLLPMLKVVIMTAIYCCLCWVQKLVVTYALLAHCVLRFHEYIYISHSSCFARFESLPTYCHSCMLILISCRFMFNLWLVMHIYASSLAHSCTFIPHPLDLYQCLCLFVLLQPDISHLFVLHLFNFIHVYVQPCNLITVLIEGLCCQFTLC